MLFSGVLFRWFVEFVVLYKIEEKSVNKVTYTINFFYCDRQMQGHSKQEKVSHCLTKQKQRDKQKIDVTIWECVLVKWENLKNIDTA